MSPTGESGLSMKPAHEDDGLTYFAPSPLTLLYWDPVEPLLKSTLVAMLS